VNGLLSSAPSQQAVRLALGGLLLQFIQSALLLLSPQLNGDDRLLIWALTPITLGLFAFALRGNLGSAGNSARSRHGR